MQAVSVEIPFGKYKLREWRPSDKASLVKYANNRKVWMNVGDTFPHPYTMSDALEWIARNQNKAPTTEFAIATKDEAIGGIGIEIQRGKTRSAGVGYWLGEPFWNKGIMTGALMAFTEYAFDNFDLVRIYARVIENNPASMRVLKKAGFIYEGRWRKSVVKDGKLLDTVRYALVK